MRNEFDYLNDVEMDFTCYEKELNTMKINSKKIKKSQKVVAVAACIAILTISTTFATRMGGNIIKIVSTGFNSFRQIDPDVPTPLMEDFRGKIYNKDGIALDSIGKNDIGNLYDKDGNKITGEMFAQMIEAATGGKVKTLDNAHSEESQVVYETLEDAKNNSVFDVKTPTYLPDGYSVSKIYAYKSEDGIVSGEYLVIEYENAKGEKIIINERILNEQTAFEMGTDGKVEEITVNGRATVIMHDTFLHFETGDNVSVSINAKDNISKAELIKIAESIK